MYEHFIINSELTHTWKGWLFFFWHISTTNCEQISYDQLFANYSSKRTRGKKSYIQASRVAKRLSGKQSLGIVTTPLLLTPVSLFMSTDSLSGARNCTDRRRDPPADFASSLSCFSVMVYRSSIDVLAGKRQVDNNWWSTIVGFAVHIGPEHPFTY